MSKISRRQFSQAVGVGAGALAFPNIAFGARPRVVVVGGGAGGAYSATAAETWTSTVIGGVLVVTNGVDKPQFWELTDGVPLSNTKMQDLTNWPSLTALNGALNDSATTVTVDSTTGFPSTGTIGVGSLSALDPNGISFIVQEQMTYTAKYIRFIYLSIFCLPLMLFSQDYTISSLQYNVFWKVFRFSGFHGSRFGRKSKTNFLFYFIFYFSKKNRKNEEKTFSLSKKS